MEECVAAIATALAPAGLGVIRLSGLNSITIAAKFFKSKKNLEELKGYEATYGKIMEEDFVLDDGVALVFRAPYSYTGEDVVEISCHGGLLILERILKLCFKNGARAAKAGEFTKRAFLNGKISLTQAEAVMEIVKADSDALLKAAVEVKNGTLFKKTEKVLSGLIEIAGHFAACLDYPEEDVEEVDIEKTKKEIEKQKTKLEKILNNTQVEHILKHGVNVSIVGNPNVGKSTLMNNICGEEKSIVTKVKGTTRDVLKHSVQIKGVNFIFSDTAGIRETEDEVEKIGVLKAVENLKYADVILFVVDENTKEKDLKILENNKDSLKVLVYNKINLKYKKKYFKNFKFDVVLETSYINKESIENLKYAIFKLKELEWLNKTDEILVLNTRQKELIKKSIENLKEFEKVLKNCSFKYSFIRLNVAS